MTMATMPATREHAANPTEDPNWTRRLMAYRDPDALRGSLELAVTTIPFVLGWAVMCWALYLGWFWLYALLLAPTAGMLVRLFMIQHDCGHGSFLPSKIVNDWIGRAISVLTLTPYDHWRRSHSIHHATAGNLDSRGIGDVDTLTVAEYQRRSWFGRLMYRLYRHPAVLFGLGPLWLFFLQNRLPMGFMLKGWRPWASTMATNFAIAAAAALMIWAIGWRPFVLVHIPVVVLGAAAGVWLFYVQHQFDETLWTKGEAWDFQQTALHGSSHYVLPAVLRWFSANIGVHHVHHLSSRIPFYRLPDVLRDYPEFRAIGRLTLLESVACVRLALWDEKLKRLVSFRELRRPRVER